MRFHFMIHADKKSARKWQNLPVPFPPRREDISKQKSDGISQIPSNLQHLVYRPDATPGKRVEI